MYYTIITLFLFIFLGRYHIPRAFFTCYGTHEFGSGAKEIGRIGGLFLVIVIR